jgi:hypothetical protein
MGTPRILLASDSTRFPDGLANSSGLVGRRLMVHPLAVVKGLFHDDIEGWRGHAGASIVSFQFYASDERRGFVGGAKWALSPGGGPLRAALTEGGEWGVGHHRHVRERFGRSAHWGLVCEDLPNEENRIELSGSVADRRGLPAPRMVYRIDDNSHALCNWHIERATESLVESGAWNVRVDLRYPANGHFMGTARMGDDPARSVVDRWCMTHDSPNLGIIDGSVFVTSGGVNPTSTIAALALRTANHLIESRSAIPRPSRRRIFAAGGVTGAPGGRDHGVMLHIKEVPLAESISDHIRRGITLVADHVIPASENMPSASQVKVAGALLDRVVALLPDLAETLNRVFVRDVGRPEEWLDELSTEDPEGYRSVLLAIAAPYYLDKEVRRLSG